MPTVGILCYSHTGHTHSVCTALGPLCGGTLWRLRAPLVRSTGAWGMFWWGGAATFGIGTPVRAPRVDWAALDALVLAAPNWAGRVAVPMRSFLRRRPALPARIGLVMTGGNPAVPDAALTQFAALAGRTPVAQCYLGEARIAAGAYGDTLAAFAARLTAPA